MEVDQRFTFGKWEENDAEYAGQHIKTSEDAIFIDQLALGKGRRSQPSSP